MRNLYSVIDWSKGHKRCCNRHAIGGLLEMTSIHFSFRAPACRGFTLIEVLVSMGILAIGLAGLAAMDVLTFRKNNDSYLRSQAILQAHEMAARMHANSLGVDNGHYNDVSGNGANPPTPNCLDRSSVLITASDC